MNYMNLGNFEKLDQRLTDAGFKQFSVPVVINIKDVDIQTDCIVDQNPELFSPFEGEVVETIISFTFKFLETGKIPRDSIITLGANQYKVDRLDPNHKRLRGHSEGDGSTIKVIARPI